MHVDAAMRPREEDYLRFIHLVDLFRDTEWEPARMMAASPFRVVDVGTNAILLRALRDLLALGARSVRLAPRLGLWLPAVRLALLLSCDR